MELTEKQFDALCNFLSVVRKLPVDSLRDGYRSINPGSPSHKGIETLSLVDLIQIVKDLEGSHRRRALVNPRMLLDQRTVLKEVRRLFTEARDSRARPATNPYTVTTHGADVYRGIPRRGESAGLLRVKGMDLKLNDQARVLRTLDTGFYWTEADTGDIIIMGTRAEVSACIGGSPSLRFVSKFDPGWGVDYEMDVKGEGDSLDQAYRRLHPNAPPMSEQLTAAARTPDLHVSVRSGRQYSEGAADGFTVETNTPAVYVGMATSVVTFAAGSANALPTAVGYADLARGAVGTGLGAANNIAGGLPAATDATKITVNVGIHPIGDRSANLGADISHDQFGAVLFRLLQTL